MPAVAWAAPLAGLPLRALSALLFIQPPLPWPAPLADTSGGSNGSGRSSALASTRWQWPPGTALQMCCALMPRSHIAHAAAMLGTDIAQAAARRAAGMRGTEKGHAAGRSAWAGKLLTARHPPRVLRVRSAMSSDMPHTAQVKVWDHDLGFGQVSYLPTRLLCEVRY